MLTILHTLESPVIESLGWALVHFLWQATLLAVLLAVVLLVLRRASSRVKYVVQCSVLLAMAACPAVTWWWIASTMKPNAVTAVHHVEPVVPNELKSGTVEPVLEPMVTGAMGLDGPIDANSIMLAPAPAMSAVASQPDQMEVPRPDQAVSWNKRVRSGMAPILPWFVGAWLLGVLVLSLRLLVGWRIVQRLKRLAVTPADAAWQLRLKALAARLRVTRTVRLVESSLIEVPTVIGWIRPMILLPVSLLTSLTPQQLEAVLAHELAHIRRHDYLVNLIQTAIETLLFYHPAVWWLSRMIRAEREHCCDDLALSLCDNPVTYVSALAAMEELRASPTLTIAATGGSLLNRIRRIALGPAHDSRRSIWWGASLIALMVIASLGVTTYIASHADDHEQKTVAITEAAETEPQAESDRPEAAAMEEFRGRVLNHLKKPVAGATVVVSVVSGDGYENRESTVATVLTDEAGDFRLSVLSSELKRNDTTSKANLWAWTSDVARDGFGVVPIQPDQEQPIKMSLFRPMTEVVELAGTNGEPVRGTVERLNFSMGVNLILPDDLFKQVLPQPMVSGSFRILGFPIDMDEEAGEEVNDVDDEEAKSPTRAEWRSMRIQTADRGRQILMWHPYLRKDVPTRLLMREPALIQGRLTTSSDALPAEISKHTEIVLYSSDSDPGESNLFRTGIARVRCDSEGRFEVRDLPAGKLAISLHTGTVTGWSWRTPRGTDGEPLELSSGVVTNVEIPLIRTRTVRGQIVTQSGQPIPNVELNVSHGTTRRKARVDKGVETTSEHRAVIRTNERGEFSVDVIPSSIFIDKSGSPGLGMLTAIRWPSDPAIALPDRGLRVDPDETPLQLPPLKLTVLTGRVIDHERRPYKGLIIAKGAEPDESFGLNYSRKDGTFRLEGIGEPSDFKVYSIENSNQIPFETPDTETTVISHNPLILQVTPKAKKADDAGEASLPNGLEFLKPYPKLHGLSLDMTEPQFLEIVKQQVLKTRKTVDGEKVTHHIALGDGHSLVVMFDKDGKCGGIQRVRGEGKNADEKLQPQVSIQDVVRGVDFSKVKVHGHDEESLRQIPDLNVPDPENPGALKSPKNVFPMPLGEHTWLMYPAGSGRFYIEHRPDGTPQSELIYGPIDGDPFEVLKLDDLFRERLKPGANAGDPRYRLTLMFHTGDPQLIRRAWRLIEPELAPQSTDDEKGPPDDEPAARYSDRDEWRENRLESLERVRDALRDEAETFHKPELSDVATRMRETVAAVEAVIDAINDSVPDESYQSATYLQPKIQAKLPDALWGKSVSGLRLGLVPTHSGPAGADWNTLPADAWMPTSIIARPGEPLHYLLMVENVSDQEIKFSGYITGEDIARSIEILDRHGKPVMYDSLHTTIPHTINHWRLKPGERKLFTMPAVYFHSVSPDVTGKGLGYHVRVPDGRYSVRCSYYFGGLDKERHRHVPGKSQWIGKLTTGTQTITFGDGGADATANAPATTPAIGLEFLKPYPKLHGLSLDMSEPQFLEIVKQQELKTRKTVDGEKVTHHIALGDGHTLIVMFGKDAKCSGIQRVRGEDKDSSNLSDKYSTPKQSPNPLVSALQPVEVNGPLDADGEVLPVGMVQRLGSTRFKVPGWWRRLAFAGNDEWVWLKADNRVSVIHRESGRVVKHHQLRLGEQNVWSLTASADGSRVAVGTTDFPPAADGTCHFRVVVLSAHTTAHLQELKWKARSGELNGLSFSADGSKLLTVSHRGNARLWELETGKMLLQQQFDGIDHVRHAALSPDAHTAVVTGLRGASMWKIAEDAAPIPLAADRCDSVSFAPNGRLFAIIAHDGVRLCNAETGESIVRLKSPEIESYSNADFGFQFTPDGKILAVPVPSHDVVELWDVETRRRLATLSVNQPRGVAISRDGRWMAAAGQDSFTAIFDLKTRQQVNQLGDGHSQEVLNVRFTGVGSLVSSSVGDARLWDIKSGKRQQTLPHESKTTTIRGLAVSPDGTLIVTSAFDDTLGLWNRATAKRLFTLKGHGTSGGTRAVKFKADGSQFVSWGDDAVLRWWNAKDGSLVAAHVLDVPDYTYQAGGRNPFASAGLCAAFTPDTSSLFVAFGEMLSEFETQTGKRLRQVPISRQASPLAVSADGRWLAAGERRRNEQGDVTSTVIVLRDRATLKAVSEWTVNNPRDVVMAAIEPERPTRVSFIAENDNGMSFSPDSKFLAWSRIDAHPGIDILEVASNRLHASIPVDSACWCLEFSPDGTQIASGHSDSTARVWDLKKPVFAVAGVAGLDFIKP